MNSEEVVARYIATWNETDPRRRAALVAQTWTEDGQYVDPLMQGEGHDGINAMIAAAQAQFPGHRFALSGAPDRHNDRLRFSWSLAADAAPIAFGTDFAVTAADGRLRSVTGFLDQAARS